MASVWGTQEFMAEHKDHSLSISMVEIFDSRYIAEIEKIDGNLFAVLGESDSKEHVENTGAYLCCHNCKVEKELNLGEVIED